MKVISANQFRLSNYKLWVNNIVLLNNCLIFKDYLTLQYRIQNIIFLLPKFALFLLKKNQLLKKFNYKKKLFYFILLFDHLKNISIKQLYLLKIFIRKKKLLINWLNLHQKKMLLNNNSFNSITNNTVGNSKISFKKILLPKALLFFFFVKFFFHTNFFYIMNSRIFIDINYILVFTKFKIILNKLFYNCSYKQTPYSFLFSYLVLFYRVIQQRNNYLVMHQLKLQSFNNNLFLKNKLKENYLKVIYYLFEKFWVQRLLINFKKINNIGVFKNLQFFKISKVMSLENFLVIIRKLNKKKSVFLKKFKVVKILFRVNKSKLISGLFNNKMLLVLKFLYFLYIFKSILKLKQILNKSVNKIINNVFEKQPFYFRYNYSYLFLIFFSFYWYKFSSRQIRNKFFLRWIFLFFTSFYLKKKFILTNYYTSEKIIIKTKWFLFKQYLFFLFEKKCYKFFFFNKKHKKIYKNFFFKKLKINLFNGVEVVQLNYKIFSFLKRRFLFYKFCFLKKILLFFFKFLNISLNSKIINFLKILKLSNYLHLVKKFNKKRGTKSFFNLKQFIFIILNFFLTKNYLQISNKKFCSIYFVFTKIIKFLQFIKNKILLKKLSLTTFFSKKQDLIIFTRMYKIYTNLLEIYKFNKTFISKYITFSKDKQFDIKTNIKDYLGELSFFQKKTFFYKKILYKLIKHYNLPFLNNSFKIKSFFRKCMALPNKYSLYLFLKRLFSKKFILKKNKFFYKKYFKLLPLEFQKLLPQIALTKNFILNNLNLKKKLFFFNNNSAVFDNIFSIKLKNYLSFSFSHFMYNLKINHIKKMIFKKVVNGKNFNKNKFSLLNYRIFLFLKNRKLINFYKKIPFFYKIFYKTNNKFILPYFNFVPKYLLRIVSNNQLIHLILLYYKNSLQSFLELLINIPVTLYLKNLSNYIKISYLIEKIIGKYKILKLKKKILNKKYTQYLNLFNILIYSLVMLNSQLLITYISLIFQMQKRHRSVLWRIYNLIKKFRFVFKSWQAIKLFVRGKINGSDRTKVFTVLVASRQGRKTQYKMQTLLLRVNYSFKHVRTYTGVFGVYIWMYK